MSHLSSPRPRRLLILSSFVKLSTLTSLILFHKFISANLPPCFACWTQSFFFDRHTCIVFQNHKRSSFRVCRGVPQGSILGPLLFSFFINNLLASLLSSVSCSLYANDLAIWSSSPLVSVVVGATQKTLNRLECWSEYWCLPPNLRSPSLACSYFLIGPSLRSSSLCWAELFCCPFSLMLYPSCFLILGLSTLSNWNAFSDCLLSSPIHLLSEASLPLQAVTLTHFALSSYEHALCLPTFYPTSGFA